MAVIFPFGEGKTERLVFKFLVEKYFSGYEFQEFISVGGKDNFRHEILKTVRSDLEAGRDEMRILAFRDLDEGEEMANVRQAFQDIVWSLLEPWGLRPEIQEVHPNSIYQWRARASTGQPGLQLVLHLANNTSLNLPVSLRNQTTDGYVLGVGLTDQVLRRFAQERKVNSDSDSLRELVIEAIPSTINRSGIVFDEDKDYLAAFLAAARFWVVRRTEEQARLIITILNRAWTYNREQFEQVFESWKLAIQEVLR